ncbi:dTDP-4-dehydrorhamnose 3,5-epimerase [Paenibacillus sp. 481]|uniref:dTDP-4-dehydrorhamnose 3,5-epimerase n=1 Tax=Paenibacillus sp. 481 TaxID=2835869 RepID=UPI001E427E3A|nr:dTDP-4-dehydrorhamnose 3,5-epimerase [Paenibacillus sp. 481]UHA71972.1 dTDP-4-dehydrorhamnose 3,5-epimerase [Paenibacillus sp. 481]
MKVRQTELAGVYVLEPNVFADGRGFFMESYHKAVLEANGVLYEFVQDNHSLSMQVGTLRGLHYQLSPMAQTKLVRVLSGAIYDVAVDIRRDSPQFGKWVGIELSAANKSQLLIPQGFAHGFCTLMPNTEVMYKVDQYYSPSHDRGIRWDDADLGIEWPERISQLSDKDERLPSLKDAELPTMPATRMVEDTNEI